MKGTITIVYDNRLFDSRLATGWGFSCFVEHAGRRVLFDTGGDPAKLHYNLGVLAIDPKDIDAVVLSHEHWDHIGGLDAVIDQNREVMLYFPQGFSGGFREGMAKRGIRCSPVTRLMEMGSGIFIGPQMYRLGPEEIPLIIQTGSGVSVITGCAHPGILRMVDTVKTQLNSDMDMVLGGFHLGFFPGLRDIVKRFKELGIKKIGPCHCTDERAIDMFQMEFKDKFIRVGAGLRISI